MNPLNKYNQPINLGGNSSFIVKENKKENKIAKYNQETEKLKKQAETMNSASYMGGTPFAIDMLKEIPQSTRTVISAIGNFGKSILQGVARSGGSVGTTLMSPFIPEEEQNATIESNPILKKAKDIIFGSAPLESLQTRIAKSEVNIKPTVGGKLALPLSIIGVAGVTGLDFTGAGGEKNVVKILSKLTKIEDISKVLKDINVAEDLIPEYSKVISGLSKEKDVSNVLSRLSEIQKTTKTVTGTSKELQPLAQEAQKYKTAEEFVKKAIANYKRDSIGTTIPGAITNNELLIRALNENPIVAKTISEKSASKLKSEDVKYLYREGSENGISWSTKPELTEKFKAYSYGNKGLKKIPLDEETLSRVAYYDNAGIGKFENMHEYEVILNPKPLSTPTGPLLQEAKKYTSARAIPQQRVYIEPVDKFSTMVTKTKELSPERKAYLDSNNITLNNIGKNEKGVSDFLAKVESNKPYFINATEDIARDLGGKYAYRMKSPGSIMIKLGRRTENNPNYSLGMIDDIFGSTVITDSIDEALIKARKNYKITNIDDFRAKPTFLGYKATHLDIELPNGQVGEIQLNTLDGLIRKTEGHLTYEKWRKYIENAQDASYEGIKAKIPKNQQAEFAIDVKHSQDIFSGKIPVQQKYVDEAMKLIKTVGKESTQAPKVNPVSVTSGGSESFSSIKTATKERQFLTSVKEARPDIPLKVGGQYVPRSTDDLAVKAKNLIKTDITTAENLARTGTDDKAVATASELIKHYSDEALKSTDQAIKNTLYEKASDVAHITATNLTNQGRAVQVASIMGRLTPEGMLRFAAKEINKYNESVDASKGLFGLKKKIPNLTPEQTKMILDEMGKIKAMPDGVEKAMAFKQLNDAIANLIPSPLFKKILSVWKAGLLTGLKTTGLNSFSNLWHGVSEVTKDIPAVAVDKVSSLFTGKRTLGLTTKGTLGGVKEGFQKGWQYLKTGFDERNAGIKLDYTKVNFGTSKIAKGLQKYEETIFHLMGAEDQPFYYGAKARSLSSQAIAQAKNAKLKGVEAKKFIDNLIKNPTDEMLKYAVSDAEIAVFQNKTQLGEAAKAIQRVGKGVGEIVVPFGRTPASVATQLINYSPVGIVKTIIENIGKGKFDQRLFSQGIGRGLTGTAIMYIGSEMFKKGLINLSYPTTEREQKLWDAEGRTANSFYDPITKKYRNLNIFGPAGSALIAGGYYQQALQETGSPTQGLLNASIGGLKSLKEQTFLQGISSVLDAINNPQGYAKGVASNLISSLIPTIVGDVANATDTKRKNVGLLDPLKAKIPGLRQTLQPQVNVFGQERQQGGNWLETMIDPSRPSNVLDSPVILELRRITDAGYNVSPTQLGDKNGYKGLTPEENTAIWKKSGELMNSKLESLFNLKQYKNLDDEDKAKMITDIIERSKTNARVLSVMDLTEDLSGQELKDKLSELKKSGLMTKEIFNEYLKFK